jgi:predicted DNA-binding transcriptional regulator AlpA
MANILAQFGSPSQEVGLWNKTQAARALGICVRTLDYKTANGQIPHVKIGKITRFIPADIEAFIQMHRIGG